MIITNEGTEKIRAHRKRRIFEDLMREMDEYNGDLEVVSIDDGRHFIIAGYDPGDTNHDNEHWLRTLATQEDAEAHLAEHEDKLRVELASLAFTQAECHRCSAVVPVKGNYVPYAPAGVVMCGDCIDPDGFEPRHRTAVTARPDDGVNEHWEMIDSGRKDDHNM